MPKASARPYERLAPLAAIGRGAPRSSRPASARLSSGSSPARATLTGIPYTAGTRGTHLRAGLDRPTASGERYEPGTGDVVFRGDQRHAY
jgi:hypothetical protein